MILTTFLLAACADALPFVHPQLMGYRSFLPEVKETARFAEMGIPLRTIFIANTVAGNGRSYCQYPLVWKGMGDYDFAPVDAQLGDILKASPKAEFILLLDLNTPIWMTRKLHYDSWNEITHAMCSPMYRNEARKYLDALVRYLEKNYGDRIKAYALLCGHTSEWFERDLRQSHPKNLAWRKWCAERGLKHGPDAPTESQLATAAFEGTVYDPATESEKIDFWRFHSWVISDAVLDFSHVAKTACGGRKPVGADYGYYMICDKDPCGVGNLDYERVLDSPDFDWILSPATYTGREVGGGTGSMLVAGSARLRGKRFFYSIDQWPHSLKCPYNANYFHTVEETVAGNTRNAAFALVHHAGFHWFDQWGGFYKDPAMTERIVKIAEIQKRFANDDSAPYADVLIVADPDSAYGRIDPRGAANGQKGAACPEGFVPAYGCGEEFRNRINHIGVGYDIVSFDDLAKMDLSPFRAIVLSDVWTISPEKAKVLRDHVLKDGRTAIWAYAPGVSDGKTLDAGRVHTWAGVDFKTPGVTTTAMDGWKAVYAYDYRELTPEKFREVLKAAGCHFWMDEPVPVMVNRRLLSIHVKAGGRKAVHLPRKCAKVVDLLNGRVVATDCTDFEDDFQSPDTKIYETVYAEAPRHVFRPTASSSALAREFLEGQKSFRLGFLPTERSNPMTVTLEDDFKRSTVAGVACLQRADRQVAICARHSLVSPEFAALVDAIESALRSPKGRIVFSGCGATGRVSILLESMWREFFARRANEMTAEERKLADRVLSIMTAGDFALIKSVEFFEDYYEGGARQTDALGVGKDDVFIALNGGGECTTILGSLARAVDRGARGFMNINNPKELLRRIERSRVLIDDPRVTILDLYCGSMALAGSTRMQSTTSQQLFYCAALERALGRVLPQFAKEVNGDYAQAFEDLLTSLEAPAARQALADMIAFEREVYAAGGRITYLADDCMLDIFTDNTERSPTFMLPQLKNRRETGLVQSWAFVKNPLYATPDCWQRMFRRAPRCLDGFSGDDARAIGMPQKAVDNPPKIGREDLLEFQIGNEPAPERIEGFPRAVAVRFLVGTPDPAFLAAADELAKAWPERRDFAVPGVFADSLLGMWKHLAVKLALNNLSTGTMAAIGRIAGNYMSWVSISNKKLTDRGCRLLRDLGNISYEEAAERLFAAQEWIESCNWDSAERPSAVQVALGDLRRKTV